MDISEADRLAREACEEIGHDYGGNPVTPGSPEHDATLAEYELELELELGR